MSKTFCIAPWHDIHIVTDGGFKGCCVMSAGETGGRYKKDGKQVTVREGIKAGIKRFIRLSKKPSMKSLKFVLFLPSNEEVIT